MYMHIYIYIYVYIYMYIYIYIYGEREREMYGRQEVARRLQGARLLVRGAVPEGCPEYCILLYKNYPNIVFYYTNIGVRRLPEYCILS